MLLPLLMMGSPLIAQQVEPVVRSEESPGAPGAALAPADLLGGPLRSADDGSIMPRRDARTITLRIPAPRGAILDRNGEVIAQNEVAYQVALQYRQFEAADRDFVVQWARTRINGLDGKIASLAELSDEQIYDHYRHRRWLPLMVSGQMTEKAALELEGKLPAGLILQPVYRRHYPHDDLAAHVIGYTGSMGKLPTGPINFNEPLWEESEGKAGFEKIFDQELTGEPATLRLLFDEDGRELLRDQVDRPRPGGTVVTTLNLKWQQLAESVLKKGTRRGAFVVIDAVTGDVLVLASRPSFDLNRFVPGISEKEFNGLLEDPARPMFGRAFQSAYPPASSFKPIVALAALNDGTINQNSTIYSGATFNVGNTVMRNWSRTPEGSINVRRALARSTNTWFYQVGIQVGPDEFLSLARRLGMGATTGLPLLGETAGLVPDDDYMMKTHRRRILNGDTANMAIGQGDLLASPLQVAQAMAGIANGGALPELHLIRQIQNSRGRVTMISQPERRNWLGLDASAIEVVREGMRDVVGSGYGTGRGGNLSYTTLAGKTGTAQWGKTSLQQRLAWFAGFLPHDNPRYAFAVVYEGRPGETVSGGRQAAPMVRNFFEPLKDEIKDVIAPPIRALEVIDEDDLDGVVTDSELPGNEAQALSVDEEKLKSREEEILRALPVDDALLPDDGEEEP